MYVPVLCARSCPRPCTEHSQRRRRPYECFQGIQKFLNDRPGYLFIFIAARTRREVASLLQHYQPARPETVRGHFAYRIDFERYTSHELVSIFRRQCESELIRLSQSTTELMLERAFALNFNFFDGTNGDGTRHLLKLARMEHSRRGGAGGVMASARGKKEAMVLESTDIQAAFQRLRQDWFAAHPDKTFTALMQVCAVEGWWCARDGRCVFLGCEVLMTYSQMQANDKGFKEQNKGLMEQQACVRLCVN